MALDATDGARRVQAIVRDLSSFARPEFRTGAPVDLLRSIEAAASLARNELRFRARLELQLSPLPALVASGGGLSQVFLNLLINAAQSIPEGHPDENSVRVRTQLAGDEVQVEVSDSGRGIPREHMDRLFDPFFSTRQPGGGAGLGLAIVHRIVTEHGGRITASSEPGRGSRFTVHLPLVAQEHAAEVAADQPPPSVGPGLGSEPPQILLVDDEPLLLRALSRVLRREGYLVHTADTAQAAQRLLGGGARFDALLLDLMMPDMLGTDLHAWLQEQHPDQAARVIFVTGGSFTPAASEHLERSGSRVLAKPVSPAELLRSLAELLG